MAGVSVERWISAVWEGVEMRGSSEYEVEVGIGGEWVGGGDEEV